MPPPTPPAGTPGEFVGATPIGLGFRVPALVISPFSQGGFVARDTFDHSSLLQLLEARFGVEVPYLTEWRRTVSGDLTSAFNFAGPVFTPPSLPAAARNDGSFNRRSHAARIASTDASGISDRPAPRSVMRTALSF